MSTYKEEMLRTVIKRKGLLRPPKRLARPIPPYVVERAYMSDLLKINERLKTIVREDFFPRLSHYVAHNPNARGDSWQDDLYDDAYEISVKFYKEFPDKDLKAMARRAGISVDRLSAHNLNNQIGKVIGIDLFGNEPWVEEELSLFALNNVQLIKTIPQRFFNDLANEVYEGFKDGDRWETIAESIGERFGVMDWNAERIARDQVGKFNSALNTRRQEEVGVEEYWWRGVGDERERDTHVANNDHKFRWDDPPPDTGAPGEDILCRCYAEPDLDKFFE